MKKKKNYPLFEFSESGRIHFYEELITKSGKINLNFIDSSILLKIISKIKEEQDKKIKEIEEKYERKFENLFKSVETKMEQLSTEFSHRIENLEAIIIDLSNFYSNPSIKAFNSIKAESQKIVLSNMKEKNEGNQCFQHIYDLLNYLLEVNRIQLINMMIINLFIFKQKITSNLYLQIKKKANFTFLYQR